MAKVSQKRRIERVFSRVGDSSIAATEETQTLHTADDAKTLIRILIDGIFYPIDNALSFAVAGEMLIAVAPGGTDVASAGTANDLDNDVTLQEITRFPFIAMQNDTNGIYVDTRVFRDIKAMRKLKKGDIVRAYYIADTASDIKCKVDIYMWFKE